MNLLLYCEIRPGLPVPDFGSAFQVRMAEKKHPDARNASLSAWTLLARGLEQLGFASLPEAAFEDGGKPCFRNLPLHFSLSHSGNLAAALISEAPCALDVQQILPEMEGRLRDRCLSDAEQRLGLDFFECWTKKECIGKLLGTGLPARPESLDTLNPEYAGRFFTGMIEGRPMCALCMNGEAPKIKKEELV